MKIKKWLLAGLALTTLTGCMVSSPQPFRAINPGLKQSLRRPTFNTFNSKLKTLRPDLPKASQPRQTVLLSYLPIDDGLDFHIPFYLNTLERTTSSRIYNVAFTDANGPGNTFAHLIRADKSNAVVSPKAHPSKKMTEMTTNSPNVLASVVSWGYSNYPGQFKAFSYLGHGGGYMGIATDNTPGQDGEKMRGMMGPNEFSAGLKKGLKGRKLDLIHLHACLMANVEAAYDLRGVAKVLFASEDVVGAHQEGTEKPTEILNTLLQQPNPDARRIAREVVIKVRPRQDPYGYATASAIDLDRIQEVKQTINVLSKSLILALPQHKAAIMKAYRSVPELKNYGGTGQRDLWTFLKGLLKVPHPQVQKEAQAVLQSLRRVLIHTRDKEGKAANGLTIYMPDHAGQSMMPGFNYKATRFAKDSLWDEFLDKLLK